MFAIIVFIRLFIIGLYCVLFILVYHIFSNFILWYIISWFMIVYCFLLSFVFQPYIALKHSLFYYFPFSITVYYLKRTFVKQYSIILHFQCFKFCMLFFISLYFSLFYCISFHHVLLFSILPYFLNVILYHMC